MQKIINGYNQDFNAKLKNLKGSHLIRVVVNKKLTVDDELLRKIIKNKTLKHQPKDVLDFFKDIYKAVEVKTDMLTSIRNVTKETLRENGYAHTGLTPKDVFLASKLLKITTQDLNLLKKPISEQSEEELTQLYGSFLKVS